MAPEPETGSASTVRTMAHTPGLHRELAQVRRVTAGFRRVDAAIAAGYELGWVNGSGVRILTGGLSSPTPKGGLKLVAVD